MYIYTYICIHTYIHTRAHQATDTCAQSPPDPSSFLAPYPAPPFPPHVQQATHAHTLFTNVHKRRAVVIICRVSFPCLRGAVLP